MKSCRGDNVDKIRRLYKKALEAVERISDEEKRLIKEIVEVSPNSIMYMGYIPIHIIGVRDDEDTDDEACKV